MAMDFGRIVQAAAEAALQSQSPTQTQPDKAKGSSKGLTAPRALLLGAGAFTVGRVLMRSRGAGVLEDLQERLATYESELFGGGEDDDEDDFDEDEEFEEEEPEGEYDEEEPEGEYDEDEPDEDDEEEEREERPRRGRRTSSAGSRNGRH